MKSTYCLATLLSLGLVSATQAGTVTSEGADLILNTKGGLSLKTTDGDYSVKLGGRLQWDYNYAELNGEADEDEIDVRRARLYVSGNVQDWKYKAQFNIGDNNGGRPEDLYIRYTGWGKAAQVTIGKQKESFGLEELTSSKDISILERSAITEAYAPGRSEGIQFHGAIDNVTYALGIFEDDSTGDDAAITGRFTYAPVKTKTSLIHLGLGYSNRADDLELAALEIAGTYGAFHAQAEYMEAEQNSAEADGFYVQAGWVITGESRPYKGGKFKRVKPKNASGAWEVVARYEDGEGNFSDIELGRAEATSYGFGVNYYANSYVRLGASYMEGEDESSPANDGSEFRARIQLTF